MDNISGNVLQTVINRMAQASSVLILTLGSSGDGLASGLALRSFLKKLDKDAVLFSLDTISERFQFLPMIDQVLPQVDLTKSFVIDVATRRSPLAELSYKKDVDRLSIFLKPTTGQLTATDVSFRSSSFPYDLVVVLGLSSFEQLGEFYAQHTDLFFETPVVNIDFRANNENYGQINLVNLAATSCSEIILDLINQFESSLLDETIATQLLTGIIVETNSFQHVRTTPQTFLKASQLVSLGARQQDIIGNLYKTKSLGLLKLWGRCLAELKQDEKLSLVYSVVTSSDISAAGADSYDIDNIIKEMAGQLSFAKTFLFLAETNLNQTTVFAQSLMPLNLIELFAAFNPQVVNHNTLKFVVNGSLTSVQAQILEILCTQLIKILPSI